MSGKGKISKTLTQKPSLTQLEIDDWASYAVASRAKELARRAKGRGLPTSGRGSGSKYSESSPESDPIGASLRTFLLSELEGLTSYSLAWKRKVTPAGRSWWVLGRSARPTDETESGLWPTARAEDSEQTGAHNGVADTLTSKAPQWHTPVAGDSKNTAYRRDRGVKGKERPTNLAMARAAEYPTPTARDHRSCTASEATHAKNSRPLSEVVGRMEDWQTPNACQADGGHRSRSGSRSQELLLGGQAVRESVNTTGRGRSSLNPVWVAQLMGYPDNWLDDGKSTFGNSATP